MFVLGPARTSARRPGPTSRAGRPIESCLGNPPPPSQMLLARALSQQGAVMNAGTEPVTSRIHPHCTAARFRPAPSAPFRGKTFLGNCPYHP